jgi:hypothetical protein
VIDRQEGEGLATSKGQNLLLPNATTRRARAADYLGLERNVVVVSAVVILGGIVTSTFLNMIVIPALFLKHGRAEGYAPARDYPGGRELAPVGD